MIEDICVSKLIKFLSQIPKAGKGKSIVSSPELILPPLFPAFYNQNGK